MQMKDLEIQTKAASRSGRSGRYVFITGAFRSGTTLLLHLLDGHPELLVFPVENCLFRDSLFSKEFPRSEPIDIQALNGFLETKSIDGILKIIFSNEKLRSPLNKRIVFKGSTGNQVLDTPFDEEQFRRAFGDTLSSLGQNRINFNIIDIFIAYNSAYFSSIGSDGSQDKRYVNKCPEKGWCINYYLENFPGSKVLHIVRDPRAVIASHKGELPKTALLPHKRFFQFLEMQNHSMKAYEEFAGSDRVYCLKYESLVLNLEEEIRKAADFLDISFESSLIEPTALGGAWRSNTSFKSEQESGSKRVYSSNVDKYLRRLTSLEISCVEAFCGERMKSLGYVTAPKAADKERLRSKYLAKSLLSWSFYASRLKARLINRHA